MQRLEDLGTWERIMSASELSDSRESSAMAARPRILWVENNSDLWEYVRRLLAERYDVEAVPDGAAALAAARAHPPDLVLCDVIMARLDGFGLVQALRADPGTRTVPVILLSTRAGEESHIEGLEAGADDYLVEPFSVRELLARVAAHLNRARVRREAEEALRTSEERYRLVVEDQTEVISRFKADGTLTFVNEVYCRLFGKTKEELQGRSWQPLAVTEDLPLIEERLQTLSAADPIVVVENRIRSARGEVRWMQFVNRGFFDAAGQLVEMQAVGRDVTDRKRAEQALWESEARLRQVLETMPAAVYTCDASGLITWFNRVACELWGRAPKLNHPDDRFCGSFKLYRPDGTPVPHDQCFMALAVLEGQTTNGAEAILERPDGTRRFVLAHANPLRNSAGQLVGGVNVLVDITERRQMEGALQSSEARLQAVVATAGDAIVTIDERGIIESANPATEKLFAYSAEELIGHNVKMLLPSPYHEELDGYLQRYLRTGEKRIVCIGREIQGRRQDGSIFPLDLAVSEFRVQGRRLFTGVIRDISARKQLEREVLEVATLEQRRIGQALHDSTGQELTALMLLAQTLSDKLEQQNPGLQPLAAKLGAGLQRVLSQVRAYSRGLIPVEVDAQGLRAALAGLASRTSELHGIRCTFDSPEPVEIEDNATATHLYHIALEAVSNAVRHAQARQISISLESDEQSLTLRIIDDGLGLPPRSRDSKGMGLKIMAYRAGLIQARLNVERGESAGTIVSCTLSRQSSVVSRPESGVSKKIPPAPRTTELPQDR
jgi:PAS domain S-box-containing protein